ncbi:MAG TPA: hypothetical protein P5204_00005 [Kiritimatiellia bacterium]|mgnify:FL=1|nr:hypothetical protein [Kiritimatiellia bacterium]
MTNKELAVRMALEEGLRIMLQSCVKETLKQGIEAAMASYEKLMDKPLDEMKRCPRCKELKFREAFGKNSKRRDGLADYCTDCSRSIQRKWALIHSDELREKRAAKRAAKRFTSSAEGSGGSNYDTKIGESVPSCKT